MRAVPLLTPRPGMGRALPQPVVQSAIVRQKVDLKPAGNTIAITTASDNPFEGSRPVSVVTQASGGMSPAPRSMQSRRLVHTDMRGLGETATKVGEPATGSTVTNFLSTVAGGFNQYTQTQIAEQERKAAEAAARAQEWKARAAIEQSQTDRILYGVRAASDATSTTLFGVKVNWVLLAVGGLAIGGALMLRNKGVKGKRR
jgi:hypothetical protein